MAPRKRVANCGGIPTQVVRNIVRTIAEVRELGFGEAARQHLLAALMRDIGSAIGVVVLDGNYRVGSRNTIEAATLAGFDQATARVFAVHQAEGTCFNPYHAAIMSKVPSSTPGQVLTADVPRRAWENSPFANEHARPVGLDHFMGSIRMLGEHRGEGIALMRERADRPFDQRAHDVLDIYMHEAPRFFAPTSRPLAPRLQRALEALATGASEKQIAADLGLSPHTVHQYTKVLFRRYRVHSRMELIQALRSGRLPEESIGQRPQF